jgi:aminoglycoside 3-N-acetyltransferase I
MAIAICQLTANDLTLMRSLLTMFGEAFGDISTYTAQQPSDAYLQQRLNDRSFITLVATIETEVVGGLVAYELKKFERERSEIYIYDLAVAARYRRQGIATALIEHLKSIATVLGAYIIFVQSDTDPVDEPAIALYSKLGTREDVLHFDIDVN